MARVVVVEDEHDVRDLLAMALDGVADIVATFPTAAAAQGWDGWADVDVCVTDHAMPGMTGAALCAWLADAHPHVKRVLTSAHRPEPHSSNADVYVDKLDLATGIHDLMVTIAGGTA